MNKSNDMIEMKCPECSSKKYEVIWAKALRCECGAMFGELPERKAIHNYIKPFFHPRPEEVQEIIYFDFTFWVQGLDRFGAIIPDSRKLSRMRGWIDADTQMVVQLW